jgi:hypothetical protein
MAIRSHRMLSGLRRSPQWLLVTAATIFALTALAPSVSSASPRSGDLHVTKECSAYTGLADSFCTIKSSNLGTIKVGSRVVYLEAAGATALDSDVVLVVGPGNFAIGHCNLPFPAGPGLCTFSGGIGKFTHFHARVVVTPDSNIPSGWYWDGTYSFKGNN